MASSSELAFKIRRMRPEEAPDVAAMTIRSFSALAPSDQQQPSGSLLSMMALADGSSHLRAHFKNNADLPQVHILVAEDTEQGGVVGTVTVDVRNTVASIGPIAVAVEWWDRGLGRSLMRKAMEVAREEGGKACVMLQQEASITKTFYLYATLGFRACDNCLQIAGLVHEGLYDSLPKGYRLRPLGVGDAKACQYLYEKVFPGFSREREIEDMAGFNSPRAFVLGDSGGDIVAYTTAMDLEGHLVAQDLEVAKAFLTAMSRHFVEDGRGHVLKFHVVTRLYPSMVEWMLCTAKLRLVRQTTLMAYGGPPPVITNPHMFYSPSITY